MQFGWLVLHFGCLSLQCFDFAERSVAAKPAVAQGDSREDCLLAKKKKKKNKEDQWCK
jgi:hypothetical protein